MEWISVKERLPKNGETVIVWGTDTNGAAAGWAVDWNDLSDSVNACWLKRWNVTHWMPLPSPPCECSEKDAKVCRSNPDIAPSYCRER